MMESSGRSSKYDDTEESHNRRSRREGQESSSSSSGRRAGDHHRSFNREQNWPARDRQRSRDRERNNGGGGGRSSDLNRDYHRDRRNDRDHYHHSSSSSSSHRHRQPRSRSPSSPHTSSSQHHRSSSQRHSSRYEKASSSSRSSRRSNRRSSSRYPAEDPLEAPPPPSDNTRVLRASRSRTPQLPESGGAQSSPSNKSSEPSRYFAGINSDSKQMIVAMDEDGDFDKEQIHKEMQERLIRHLAREGKVYPPPKPQASHPVFANDGSFLETFKRLQGGDVGAPSSTYEQYSVAPQQRLQQQRQPPQQQPMFGKRRGGKILKTGIVAKPKPIEEPDAAANKNDAWAMYLQEVKKYKSVSCDTDEKTRPLVK